MYKFQLYIGEDLVELFKDETITLNSTVQNIRDISKVFTDFTQSFTVPASQNNNRLFSHWYNVDITGGFSSATRAESTIELNHLPFRPAGLTQLENVMMKNNKPFSYKITFYGNLVSLSDLFGEDVLNDLNLEDFNHDYTSNQVKLGIQGTSLESGNIIYPLISNRNWVWDAQTTSLSDDDILYDNVTPNTNGIIWNSLKPAIKIARVMEAVEVKYGITFSDEFFGTADFEKIFIWCSPNKDNIPIFGDWTKIICDVQLTDPSGGYDPVTGVFTLVDTSSHKYSMTIDPASGFESVIYSMAFYINGVLDSELINQSGAGGFLINYAGAVSDTVEIYVKAGEAFDFSATFDSVTQFTAETNLDVSLSVTGFVYLTDTTVLGVPIAGIMPDIEVGKFLSGIINMFNLVIIADSRTSFTIRTLDSWYSAGSVFNDIDQFIDIDEVGIDRPKLNKVIEFKYQESETILAEQFRETNNIGYGDLEAEFDYDGGTLEIELPFENLVGERLGSVNDGSISDTHVHKAIDKDLETTNIKPFLFYLKGQTSLSAGVNGISFQNDVGTLEEITVYNQIGQENALTDGAITGSLNFGSEISTWTFTAQTESLFSNFWTDFVSDLYDTKRRVFHFKAKFPLSIITRIELNDILIIKERAYQINNMNIDFTTGETKLELLNFIGELTGTEVNKFLELDLNIEV